MMLYRLFPFQWFKFVPFLKCHHWWDEVTFYALYDRSMAIRRQFK